MVRIILLIAAILIAFNSCSSDTWEGIVYPNSDNLTKYHSVGVYNSLEECLDACISELDRIDALNRGEYECGKNCKRHPSDPELRICEETRG